MLTFRLTPASSFGPAHRAWLDGVRTRALGLHGDIADRVKAPDVDGVLRAEVRAYMVRPLWQIGHHGDHLRWGPVRRLDWMTRQGTAPLGGRYLLFGEGSAFVATDGEDLAAPSELWTIARDALRQAFDGEGVTGAALVREVQAVGLHTQASALSRFLRGEQARLDVDVLDALFRACGTSLSWALNAA